MHAAILGMAAVLPALAQAGVLEFKFTGGLNPNEGQGATFQGMFFANTSQATSVAYGFVGGCVANVNASFSIYDFNLNVNGDSVMTGGKGTFNASTPAPDVGCSGFFSDEAVNISATATGKTFAVNGGGDGSLFGSQSAIVASRDPLGLIFSTASFEGSPGISSDFMACSVPGFAPISSSGPPASFCDLQFNATLVNGAPEPELLGLFAVGGVGLILFRRRGRTRLTLSEHLGLATV